MVRELTLSFLLANALSVNAQAQSANFVEYAGCTNEDFVEIADAEVLIEFQGSSYEPACIKIKPGTKVTISASSRHPLQASIDFNSLVNPFRSADGEFLENQTRVLDVPGFVGYYCTRHGDPESGRGMGGMIWVMENPTP